MNERRSTWVDAVALLYLLPGVMILLAVSLAGWLAGLSTVSVNGKEIEELRNVLLLVVGFALLVPVMLALPLFFVGLGLFRRRVWARFIGLYLGFGFAGTGLLGMLSGGGGWGAGLLAYAAPTLTVLLLPRFAREFQS